MSFEPDINEVLGRGFKCGFLGQLHFEITAERLEKEFKIKTVSTFPSVAYKVKIEKSDEYKIIKTIEDLPDDVSEILEPFIKIEIIAPIKFLGSVLKLKEIFISYWRYTIYLYTLQSGFKINMGYFKKI